MSLKFESFTVKKEEASPGQLADARLKALKEGKDLKEAEGELLKEFEKQNDIKEYNADLKFTATRGHGNEMH